MHCETIKNLLVKLNSERPGPLWFCFYCS